MKFIFVALFLIQLTIVANVFSNPIESELKRLNSSDIDSIKQSSDNDKPNTRIARDCECKTTTGRCVPQGNYQCYFVNGASIVQCINGEWKHVSQCGGTCKTLHNDQPYCL